MKGLAWCLVRGGSWWTAVSIISVDVLNSSAYDLQACPYSQGVWTVYWSNFLTPNAINILLYQNGS